MREGKSTEVTSMPPEKFTKRDINRAFRDFSDLATDVEAADWQAWLENLRHFLHHCETNPVMQTVLGPLEIDYADWFKTVEGSETALPKAEAEKLAAYYATLREASKAPNITGFLIEFLLKAFGYRAGMVGMVSFFNQEIFSKFVRSIQYRLEEIEEDIEGQTEIPREALVVFNLHNHGTFIAGGIYAENSQIAVGSSAISDSTIESN